MYYVYVLKSLTNGDLYVGFSEDLKKRFAEHNKGLAKTTKPNRPWILVYYEAYRGKRDATIRERQLKNHAAKDDLRGQIKYSLDNL